MTDNDEVSHFSDHITRHLMPELKPRPRRTLIHSHTGTGTYVTVSIMEQTN